MSSAASFLSAAEQALSQAKSGAAPPASKSSSSSSPSPSSADEQPVDSQFVLPAVEAFTDAQLAELGLHDLLRRVLLLQQARSLTYSLYHQAFASLVRAAEQIALEEEDGDAGSGSGNHDHHHHGHGRGHGHGHGCGGGDAGQFQPRPIDPQKVKPAFEAFSQISGAIARHFQLISTNVIQVEHTLLRRAAVAAGAGPADPQARAHAVLIRKLQEFEKRKLETTVRYQAIVSRHRVIQYDPFGQEFAQLSSGLRKSLGELVEGINDVLEELRAELFSELE